MPKFIWTVKNHHGDRQIREVTADTVTAAQMALEAEGCTDLVLETDEIYDVVQAERKPATFFGEPIQRTAAQKLKIRAQEPRTFWTVLRDGVRRTWAVLVVIGLVTLEEMVRGNWLSAQILAGCLLLWLGTLILNGLPSILFRQCVTALEWSRWRQVLAICTRMEWLSRVHHLKVPPYFLAQSRAKALAGLGWLPEAVALFAPFAGTPGCPVWLHHLFMAGIYYIGQDNAAGLACTRASVAEKPGTVGYLELATRLVRHHHDPAAARQALAGVSKTTMTANEQTFYLRCRGMIAWREGQAGPARRDFEAALAMMLKSPHEFYRYGGICVTKGWLACVLAHQGERAAAEQHFTAARKYLAATGETELMEEYAKLTGAGDRRS